MRNSRQFAELMPRKALNKFRLASNLCERRGSEGDLFVLIHYRRNSAGRFIFICILHNILEIIKTDSSTR
jgi:hypothetical protein